MSSASKNQTFTKDPDALLDYDCDWAATEKPGPWLVSGDTIASVEWIVPDGLTQGDATHTDTTTTVWLGGGTAGARYEVVTRITTAQGRVADQTQIFNIAHR